MTQSLQLPNATEWRVSARLFLCRSPSPSQDLSSHRAGECGGPGAGRKQVGISSCCFCSEPEVLLSNGVPPKLPESRLVSCTCSISLKGDNRCQRRKSSSTEGAGTDRRPRAPSWSWIQALGAMPVTHQGSWPPLVCLNKV